MSVPRTVAAVLKDHVTLGVEGIDRIDFDALGNGVLRCADPKRLQQICQGLSGEKIDALLRKLAAAVAASLHRRRP